MADLVPLTPEQRAEVTRELADAFADVIAGIREKLTAEQLCSAGQMVDEITKLIIEVDGGSDKFWREVIFSSAIKAALAAPEPEAARAVGKRGRPRRPELLSPKERERLKKKLSRPLNSGEYGPVIGDLRRYPDPILKCMLEIARKLREDGLENFKFYQKARLTLSSAKVDPSPEEVRQVVRWFEWAISPPER
ncbi:MAG: hypothetical protein IOC63_07870 [Methylobacterium sp.]|nr:hypothetical protein [Methylobacterium sp.]